MVARLTTVVVSLMLYWMVFGQIISYRYVFNEFGVKNFGQAS